MEYGVDSNIIIIRDANDILNSAYLSSVSDGKCEFPSVEHYCQFQILLRAGLPAEAQEILQIPNLRSDCKFVRNLVIAHVCRGDVESGNRFLTDVKDEYLRVGLRLRFAQDHSFRRALMDTGRALLAHCDSEDFQYGLGMDEKTFLKWVDSSGMKPEILLNWFRRYDLCPRQDTIGNNKLGLALMEIRAEEYDRLRRSSPSLGSIGSFPPRVSSRLDQPPRSLASVAPFPATRPAITPVPPGSVLPLPPLAQPVGVPFRSPADFSASFKQLSQAEIDEFMSQRYVLPASEEGDDDGDWIVSDQILALEGPFAVLSQYYPTPFVTRKRRYRSVEHYAYQKFFQKLKLRPKAMEKLITTPDPSKLSGLARRLLIDFWDKRGENNGKSAVEQCAPGGRGNNTGSTKSKNESPVDEDQQETNFYDRLLEYYERATKLKFDQYPVLKRLLVATGDTLLIETCPTTDRRAACEWTMCAQEADVQHFLTTSAYNTGDLLRFILKPEKKFFRFFAGTVGRNRAGLALMRLRREYRRANVELLHLPPPPPTGGELDESRLICFTSTSVFHPAYVSPFWTKEGEVYTSVQHFICMEAAKKFGFSDSVKKKLASCDSSKVDQWMSWYIYQRFPDPEAYLEWFWTGGRDEMFKIGSRLKFEKHPDLLRALLETGNSLMVYCRARFQSEDTEWSIGMTERDLKLWMQESRCDCRTLLKWCLSPLEKRPAFLGGNRLGALLMELRREFRLRGFQAHTLPKLGLPVEVVLGTGSEDTEEDLDNDDGADTVWPSPHFLLAKKRGQPVLDRANKKRKLNDYSSSAPATATALPQPSPAAMVALMGIDQLKQSAAMLVSKLSAMRKETDSENDMLYRLLTELSEIRDRVPAIDLPAAVYDTSSKSVANDSKQTEPVRQTAPIPSVSEQKEKWFSFEAGLLSVLRKAASKAMKHEQLELPDEDQSLFNPKNWDEQRVRPLVDRVWPHLTIRERRTASEWLWYTIGKLEAMRWTRRNQGRSDGSVAADRGFGCLVPTQRRERTWIMPQMKMVMTQKASDANEARAATPQGEGTTIDATKYAVSWVIPETGVFPRILAPVSP